MEGGAPLSSVSVVCAAFRVLFTVKAALARLAAAPRSSLKVSARDLRSTVAESSVGAAVSWLR